MEINCVSCGFKVDLADSYDNYQGQIKCFACGAILEITTLEGNVCSVEIAKDVLSLPVEEVFEIVEVVGQGRG
jgi:DNA-directed RNA polymerase subunit RPC12/RpoP